MSQYQTKESIVSFIGSSDGSVSGALADAVLERPYSLILLDEFEKAHPDILNLFLAIFDDGKMNDSVGRAVDFTNTIIIATSNAHSGLIKEEIEKGTSIATISDLLKKRLVEYFKPELLNRFSDIIVFKSLSRADTVEIAKLNLQEVISAMQQAQAVDLVFEATAVQKIAELGYDPVFGARPLRKVISEQIRGVLAEQVLKGEIPRGCKLTVSHNGHSFVFEQSEK
jgi:ATP-dependent Clp protease ATP-binding subunit ClpA